MQAFLPFQGRCHEVAEGYKYICQIFPRGDAAQRQRGTKKGHTVVCPFL